MAGDVGRLRGRDALRRGRDPAAGAAEGRSWPAQHRNQLAGLGAAAVVLAGRREAALGEAAEGLSAAGKPAGYVAWAVSERARRAECAARAAARPRRIAITSDDVVWYTDYARGYLGRLDPATGGVEEWPSPSGARSRPYGIAALDDALWYCETGVEPNTLVRFDPATRTFQTWVIPAGGGVGGGGGRRPPGRT